MVGIPNHRLASDFGVVGTQKSGVDVSTQLENSMSGETQTLSPPNQYAVKSKSVAMLAPTRSALEMFADRRAKLLLLRGLAIGFVIFVVGMLLLVVADRFVRVETIWRVLASLIVDAIAVGAAWRFGIRESRQRDWTTIAQRMETSTPSLREQMLSAVELGDANAANGSVEFQSQLQNHVADQASRLEVKRMLPWGLIRNWTLAATGTAMLVGLLSLVPSWQLPRRLARVIVPIAPIERASLTKIEIIRPTPHSLSVAEGDLVAVAVSVSKLGSENVRLQIRSDNSVNETLLMSPRSDQQTYAVNVQVHQTPVLYRVLAGDGETLWHTLTPRPRPKLVSFQKRYQFPSYARLPDRTSTDEFGDLAGIVGTQASVVVTFDQPVGQAELLFGDGRDDARIPVRALDGSNTRFEYQIPIKTPGTYRVDGVSLDSELNNPFSPRFSIDPVIDQAPIARWSLGTAPRQIVSPASVIRLSGMIEDDLPMDAFIQQFVLDDGEVVERKRLIQASLADPTASGPRASETLPADDDFGDVSQVALSWDMMDHDGTGTPSPLPPGSQLKTRLIAVDRAGNRGASQWIHLFIAGGDFDPSRHDELIQLQTFSRRVQNWVDDFSRFLDQIQQAAKDFKDAPQGKPTINPGWKLTLKGLETSWTELSGVNDRQSIQPIEDAKTDSPTIVRQVATTNDSVEAERWVLLDRFATTAMTDLAEAIRVWETAQEIQAGSASRTQEQLVRLGTSIVSRAGKPTRQVNDFSRWHLSVELAAGLMRDLQMIQSDAEVLADENSTVPIQRLPGQADLMVERLRQVGDLATSMQADLPDNTVRHQERLHRYLAELTARIEQENEKLQLEQNPDVVSNFRDAMNRFVDELRYHRTTSLLQGDTFNQIASAVRELNRRDWMPSQQIDQLREASRDRDRAKTQIEKARNQQDTAAISAAVDDESHSTQRFESLVRTTLAQYERAETIQRQRRDTNVQEVSDLRLIGKVIEIVTVDDFKLSPKVDLPESISLESLLDMIRKAAMTLEAGNQTKRLVGQLQDLADRERYGNDLADGAIRQGLRLEHYQVASETPLQLLRDAGVDSSVIENLQATRWDKDFQQARQWTTSRRYESGPFVSATAPVQSMVDRYRDRIEAIEAIMRQARQRLKQLLPTTGELARDAAAEAKKKSKQEFDTLREKVDAVAENLADRANTADYEKEAERELAQDADAALAALQEQMKAVATETDTEELERSFDELTQTLQDTAEHFDAADAGEDVSQTRQALREAFSLPETEAAARSANATAQAANSTPDELLERLEQRLEQDEVMKDELADISQQTAAAVEQALRAVSKQEKNIQQELEKADPEFLEKKRTLRDQLKSLTDQSRAVNDHWLAMAESVSGWNQDQDSRERLRESREQLRKAVDQAEQIQNDQALLSELESTSETLKQTLKSVAESIGNVEDRASQKADDEVHNNEKSRQQKARQLESAQRQTQNRWLQSLAAQAKDWKQRRDQAGKRVQSAQNQERNAQRQLDQAEQQLEKHPGEDWAQRGVRESRERVDDAIRAGEQAKQTRQAAEQAENEASQRMKDARKSTVKDLNANNPSAELLARVAEKSANELTRISNDLQSIEDQTELATSLSPSVSSANRLAEQQTQASQTVQQAAEDLQRAARHEERLGNTQVAGQLDQAASELQATLNDTMSTAQQSLDQSGDPTSSKPMAQRSDAAQQASQQLGKASEQLAAQADRIAEFQGRLAAQSETAQQATSQDSSPTSQDGREDDRNGAAPADPSPMKEMSTGTLAEASRSEKLARTLDELDRGINQSNASPNESSQAGESSEGGETSNDASNQPSKQASSKSSSKPATAGEASPTLAASAEQAIRELAAQRQQQLQQIASAGEPSQSSSENGESPSQSDSMSEGESGNPAEGEQGKPGTVSGDGSQMPDGGLIDASLQSRIDGDWGALREQKNSDVIQDRKANLPMSYRPAIEAYFQAISAEAARSNSNRKVSRE